MGKIFHPKVRKRKRTHGFLIRRRRPAGGRVLRDRRRKGRRRLAG